MKKYFESGRSMVEIIGVLAVAGVLSIGAVSGYKYGMNKYRAHETINELKLRAIALSNQVIRGEIVELNMEMGDKTKLGYTTDAWIDEKDTQYFYISLEDHPQEICAEILKEKWTLPLFTYVGVNEFTGDNVDICGEGKYSPPMEFKFYADLAERVEFEEVYIPDIAPEEEVSEVTYPTPQQGCDDPDYPLGGTDGNCYSCNDNSDVNVGSNGLCTEICPNRQKSDTSCRITECPADAPLTADDGSCHPCDDPETITLLYGQKCEETCPNRQQGGLKCYNTHCPDDKPLMDYYGACHACDATNKVDVEYVWKCSEACSNRQLGGYYCYLSKCPSDKPLMDTNGNCYACDVDSAIKVAVGNSKYGMHGACSEICPNRQLSSYYCIKPEPKDPCPADKPLMDRQGNCYTCDYSQEYQDFFAYGECSEVCPNREITPNGACQIKCNGKPLRDWYNQCYSCDDINAISIYSNDPCSEVCPNRKTFTVNGYSYCSLVTCPRDAPLRNPTTGVCLPCNYSFAVSIGTDMECQEICSNRAWTSPGVCGLREECPPDKPLRDTYGECYACDDDAKINVEHGPCTAVCPNRVLTPTNYCVLPCPADKPLMSERGYCSACNTTDSVEVGIGGKCSEICPDRDMNGAECYLSACPADKPLREATDKGPCYACNYSSKVFVERGQCSEVCLNRQKVGYYCYNKKCPTDKPLMDSDGNCYACDDDSVVYIGSNYSIGGGDDFTAYCSGICSNRQIHKQSYCVLSSCPANKPLRGSDGNCYGCDETSVLYVGTKGKCSDACSNRTRTGNSDKCALSCPADKPLMDKEGSCYACDIDGIDVGPVGKCSEVCSGRVKNDKNICAKSCPADKPLMDEAGNCYACDNISRIKVGSDKCSEVCTNRVKTDIGYCSLSCDSNKPLMHVNGVCYSCSTKDGVYVGSGACEEVCANRTKRSDGHCYLDEEEEVVE